MNPQEIIFNADKVGNITLEKGNFQFLKKSTFNILFGCFQSRAKSMIVDVLIPHFHFQNE